jgi:hypothetical protein
MKLTVNLLLLKNSKIFIAMRTGFGGRYVMDDANVPVNCTTTAFGVL